MLSRDQLYELSHTQLLRPSRGLRIEFYYGLASDYRLDPA